MIFALEALAEGWTRAAGAGIPNVGGGYYEVEAG